MRQSRAHDDERRAELGQLVAGGAERGDVLGADVLHLVDEDGDAGADVGGDRRRVAEQLDQVDLDVAGVGASAAGRHVDAGLPAVAQLGRRAAAPGGSGALRERLEYAEERVDPVRGAVPGRQFADRHVQRGGDRPAQRLVRPGLDLAGAPEVVDRLGAQRVEQDRLAHSPQAGEHQAAFGATAGDPFQHHVEDVQFPPPPGEFGRALAGARCVRVADRIHGSHSIGFSSDQARCA